MIVLELEKGVSVKVGNSFGAVARDEDLSAINSVLYTIRTVVQDGQSKFEMVFLKFDQNPTVHVKQGLAESSIEIQSQSRVAIDSAIDKNTIARSKHRVDGEFKMRNGKPSGMIFAFETRIEDPFTVSFAKRKSVGRE